MWIAIICQPYKWIDSIKVVELMEKLTNANNNNFMSGKPKLPKTVSFLNGPNHRRMYIYNVLYRQKTFES